MPSVDNRVVEMRFDNKQFESRVGTSLTTLEKLKKSLNLDNAAKGFNTLDKAANGVNLSGLSAAAQTVTEHFSAFGLIGDQVLRRIGDAVYDLQLKMINLVKGMSVDQITAGFTKYEQKTGSVQTIMNATGKSIGDINRYLDRLMWYSDETSFGFTDMTTALQTMTASGGELDNLIPMLMGIGNATAFAGKGAGEFSRVMYNLNQAYSMGFLGTQDWKSIELMGVSSKQLKEQLIASAEALGNIRKGAYGMEDFSTLLTKKVFDKKVMEDAFGKFAEMTVKAEELVNNGTFDTASEAYDYLATQYDGVAVKAAKAAQEAKTFTEAIDATKDAVSSGWMKTFELIVGDYDEAKTLWTKLANDLWDMFAGGAESRNAMLTTWHNFGYDGLTGYQALMESLSNIWSGFSSIVYSVRDALSDIFPPMTAKKLTDITFKFKELTARFKDAFHYGEDLQSVIKEVMAPFNKVSKGTAEFSDGVTKSKQAIEEVTDSNTGLKDSAEEVGEAYSFSAEKYREAVKEVQKRTGTSDNILTIQKIMGGIASALSIIGQAGKAVWDEVIQPASGIAIQILTPIGDVLAWIGEKIKDLNKEFKKTNFFTKMLKPIGNVLRWIGDRLKALNKKLKETNFFGRNLEKVVNVLKRFRDRLKEIWEKAKELDSVKSLIDRFTKFRESLEGDKFPFIDRINGFFDKLDDVDIPLPKLEDALDAIDKIAQKVGGFLDSIEEGWPKVKGFFDSIDFTNAKTTIDSASNNVKDFIKNIFEDESVKESSETLFSNIWAGLEGALSKIDWGKTLLTVFGGLTGAGFLSLLFGAGKLTNGMGDVTKTLAKVLGGAANVLGSVGKAVKAYANDRNATAILKLAIAIGILAAALIALTYVDSEKLTQAAVDLSVLVGTLALLAWVISKFKSGTQFENTMGLFANSGKINIKLPKTAMIFTALGLSLLGLAAALYVITRIPEDDILRVTTTLLALFGGIAIIAALIPQMLGTFGALNARTFATGILLMASAMLIMASAAGILSFIKPERLDSVVTNLGLIIGVMAAALGVGTYLGNPKGFIKMAVAFLIMASAIAVLTGPLMLLSTVSGKLWPVVGALSLLVIALGGIVALLSYDKWFKNVDSAAKAMIIMAGAMVLMSAGLMALGNIPSLKKMWIGFAALAATIVLFVGAAWLIETLGLTDVLYAVAAALTSVGLTVALVGAGALMFAKAMQLLSDSSVDAKKAGQNLAQGIIAFFDEIMANGQSILKFVILLVGLIVAAVIAVMAAKKMDLVNSAIGMFKALATAIPAVGPELLAALGILLGMLLEWLGVQVGPLVEALIALLLITINSLAAAILKYSDDIFKAIENVINALGTLLVKAIAQVIEWAFGPILGIIEKAFGFDLTDWVDETLGGPVVSDLEEHNKELRGKLGETAEIIKGGGEDIGNAAEEANRTIGQRVKNVTGPAKGIFAPSSEEITSEYNSATNAVNTSGGEFANAVDEIKTHVEEDEDGTQLIIFDTLPERIETGFTGATEAVTVNGNAFMGELQKQFDEGELTTEEFGAAIMNGVENGLLTNEQGSLLAAHNNMTDILEKLASTAGINSPSTVTTEQGKNLDLGLAVGMSSNVNLVRIAARTVMNNAVSALSPLYGKFRQSGRDAVRGLVNGIGDNMYLVSQKARVMGNTLLNVFDSTIDRGSPAKEFIARGRDINRGLGIGIERYQYFTTSAAEELGIAAIDRVRGIINDLANAINNDVDVNPTITPVLDLSEIQNGGSRINTLLTGGGLSFTPNIAYARAAGDAVEDGSTSNRGDSNAGILNAIREIRGDISELNSSMTKMKVYIDKNLLVGSMMSDIDYGLNTRAGYKRRGI